MADLKVQALREMKTKYDLVIRGETILLELEPCSCGVHAMFVAVKKIKDILPPEVKAMLSNPNVQVGFDPDKEVKHIVEDWHYKARPLDWLFGMTMEKQLHRWIKATHAKLQKMSDHGSIAGLKNRLGILEEP